MPELATRASILEQAGEYVHTDRNSNYGDPEDNFGVISELMRAYLKRRFGVDIPIEAYDVANLMFAVKLGRLAHNPLHHDSYVDMAGYAAAGGEVAAQYDRDSVSTIPYSDRVELLRDALDGFREVMDDIEESTFTVGEEVRLRAGETP